jgi:hypothetical protein
MIEKRWYTINGRQVYRAVPSARSAGAGSDFPCPRFVKDEIEPTWGADGGNPRGERFIEYGNEPIPQYEAPKFDKSARAEAIKQAIHDVESGNVPDV